MNNVFITVNPNTDSAYKSDIYKVKGMSQTEILVSLGDKTYHQNYTFSFTRLGNSATDPILAFDRQMPLDWSFMIEQQLDTVWVKSFKVN